MNTTPKQIADELAERVAVSMVQMVFMGNKAYKAKDYYVPSKESFKQIILQDVALESLITDGQRLKELINKRKKLPKIVCLCGSTRFGEVFREWNLRETIAGNIVLSIGCNLKSDSDLIAAGLLKESDKVALDELHKRKIDLCNEVLVLNVGGYIGASTKSEIEYAQAHNKPIRYLETLGTAITAAMNKDAEVLRKKG